MKKWCLWSTCGHLFKPINPFHLSTITLFLCKIFEPWFKFPIKRCHHANEIVLNLDISPWLIPTIKNILHKPVALLSKSPMKFEFAKEAMCHNSGILFFYCNMEYLIQAYPHSDISCSNEFSANSILEPILHDYKDWIRVKGYLSNGLIPSSK